MLVSGGSSLSVSSTLDVTINARIVLASWSLECPNSWRRLMISGCSTVLDLEKKVEILPTKEPR